jgi:hypothetical protein
MLPTLVRHMDAATESQNGACISMNGNAAMPQAAMSRSAGTVKTQINQQTGYRGQEGEQNSELRGVSHALLPFPFAQVVPFRCTREIFLAAMTQVPFRSHRSPHVRTATAKMLRYVFSAFVADVNISKSRESACRQSCLLRRNQV